MALQRQHFVINPEDNFDGFEDFQKEVNEFLKREDITPVEVRDLVVDKILITAITYIDKTKEEMAQAKQPSKIVSAGGPIPFPAGLKK
jgi:hypothetical protein